MDRHQPHGVGVGVVDGRLGLALLRLLQRGGVVDEGAQVPAFGRLELPRQAQQLVHIGQPLARVWVVLFL